MSTTPFDTRQILQAPGPRPVLRLLVADPAGVVGGPLLREFAPELTVATADPGNPLAPSATETPALAWALLAMASGAPGAGAAVLARAVRAARIGPPPAHLLLCPGPFAEPTGCDGFTEVVLADVDAAALPCPVTVLLAEDLPSGGRTGHTGVAASWLRLSPDAFTVRLLGPDAWSPGPNGAVTARIVKEELRVWPA
ncbi:hypothetical protein ACFYY3_11385 [Streptomyces sp. NPDC001812]|uniref:hypothetical protein n=1 Tax=Streptomyces sp. NPDC001812 TaxID=3364611 RepID=UPI00368F0997